MKLTNKYNLPDTFVNCVKSLVYDPREKDPKRISITSLINNPRPKILMSKHWDDVEEDVSDHIWRILGSGVHDIIEKTGKANNNTLSEEKMTAEVDGMTVVGKLDLYDGTSKSVIDYKITSIWSVKFGEHDEWEQQLNPYAWLLRKAGFEVNSLQINAILKDWRKSEGLKYDDYPKIPFMVIPVKLWSFKEQEDFVEHRVALYKDSIGLAIDDLPICGPKERWAKNSVYAVYKNSNKTASRLLNSSTEANTWAQANIKQGDTFKIVERVGEDLKCVSYCSANKFCSYWQETYNKP